MIWNLFRTALFFFIFGAAASVSVGANAQSLALVGGRVYKSPDAAPLLDAVVLTSGGAITAIVRNRRGAYLKDNLFAVYRG